MPQLWRLYFSHFGFWGLGLPTTLQWSLQCLGYGPLAFRGQIFPSGKLILGCIFNLQTDLHRRRYVISLVWRLRTIINFFTGPLCFAGNVYGPDAQVFYQTSRFVLIYHFYCLSHVKTSELSRYKFVKSDGPWGAILSDTKRLGYVPQTACWCHNTSC